MVDDLPELHHRISKTLISYLACRGISGKPTLFADSVIDKLLPI
jgi:hypothetical protein